MFRIIAPASILLGAMPAHATIAHGALFDFLTEGNKEAG